MGLIASRRGLRRIFLPQVSQRATELLLNKYLGNAVVDEQPFGDLPYRLKSYLNGEPVTFPDSLDLASATPFQQSIWLAARSIPYGETRSYGWLACEVGKPKASRAAGQALARNPLPIVIPCHRVIAHNGNLGGFSGGEKLKQYLLEMEKSTRYESKHNGILPYPEEL